MLTQRDWEIRSFALKTVIGHSFDIYFIKKNVEQYSLNISTNCTICDYIYKCPNYTLHSLHQYSIVSMSH